MPKKLYRIGDAAKLLNLKPYVLRYWETEFPKLRPIRSGKGQRRYTEEDMALLIRIRYLLHEQGMTIEGARKLLDGVSGLTASEYHNPDRQVENFSEHMPLALSAPAKEAASTDDEISVHAVSGHNVSGQSNPAGQIEQIVAELRSLQALIRHGGPA